MIMNDCYHIEWIHNQIMCMVANIQNRLAVGLVLCFLHVLQHLCCIHTSFYIVDGVGLRRVHKQDKVS